MLGHMNFSARDALWKKILSDLHAETADGGITFPDPEKKLSLSEIISRAESLAAARIEHLGAGALSESERRLALMLPADADELKRRMGYADGARTHTIETMIYNVRKKMGADFIKLKDGVYSL
jgi:hypothetical protein